MYLENISVYSSADHIYANSGIINIHRAAVGHGGRRGHEAIEEQMMMVLIHKAEGKHKAMNNELHIGVTSNQNLTVWIVLTVGMHIQLHDGQ